ncbi:uncharacterized protein LOC135391579 [Ornithodoros turicata]|uniref:uncharacterized protein LOC135391579 n=1 Tax=Ornithodoros turicata TaxID=34597 RepID=UPI00313942AC
MALRKRPLRRRSVYAVVVALSLCGLMVLLQILYVDEDQADDAALERFLAVTRTPADNRTLSQLLKDSVHDRWQPVRHTTDKFYVFSAFLDQRRTQAIVRVIGAARTRLTDRVSCSFYVRGTLSAAVRASNKLIRENWNLRYSAFFLLCPVPAGPWPDTVAVVRINDRNLPGNMLQVHKLQPSTPKEDIAVCVKPIHYDYDKLLQLAEFVELNRVLGVSHFILYNHTAGPHVSCLLQRYQSQGIVTLLPWQLPMVSQREIRTEGLFAALNDCLYRGMSRFRWLAMIDLDEFIVPAGNISLPVLLRRLGESAGAFSFRNGFFYLQWGDDPVADVPLLTMRKTRRKAQLHAHRQRSKCVVSPERVVEMGNHFVWEFLTADKVTVNVAAELAFLHHYRVCEFGGDDCINTTSVVDRSLYFWKDKLAPAVEHSVKSCTHQDSFHL